MADITQEITTFDTDLPDKGDMTADEFDVAAELWVDYQDGLATELNTFATQANSLKVDVNALKDLAETAVTDCQTEVTNCEDEVINCQTEVTAAEAARDICYSTANFKGEWDDLTGALAIPASVYHDGQYWVLLSGLADVTASEPASDNSDWAIGPFAHLTVAKTGNYTITAIDALQNIIFTNTGASGAIEFSLPPVAVNYKASFLVTAAQYLKCTADGTEKIRYLTNQSAAGGYVRSDVIGTYWTLDGSSGTEWTMTELEGNILVDE